MSSQQSHIKEFFKNQTIFLTGGSGFLGKLLIEKLLRECKHLNKIYVLIRTKKNKSPNERFQELFDYPCFNLLKSKEINFKEKVFLVNGDCKMPFLGLDNISSDILKEEVTCVIHAAANVKFDQTLKEAAYYVRATKDLLTLAKEMKKLKSFVYVSTAYSNCIHTVIKEKFYQPPMKAEQLWTIVEGMDEEVLENITPGLLGKWPNTYVYTKCITEDLIKTFSKDLPLSIVRPAIIISTIEEPFPGWIDNFYGLIGIGSGAALGVIRSMHIKGNNPAYIVPVDYIANLVLAAAWNTTKSQDTIIYNCYGHKNNLLTWKSVIDLLVKNGWNSVSEKVIWYYTFKMRENRLWHKICVFFLHTVQAYVVDFILFCLGKPTLAVQFYRKLNKMLDKVSYFSTGTWYFDDDNLMKLWDEMGDEDKRLFKFNMEKIDWNSFCRDGVLGGRLHLLKDTPDTIPKGNKKLRILCVAHYTIIGVFWFLVFKLVKILLSFFFSKKT